MSDSDSTTDKASGGAALPAGAHDSRAGPRRQPAREGKAQGQAGDPAVGGKGQGERQGFDRQRLDPQDSPPADVLDDENVAGDKDFELKPPGGG